EPPGDVAQREARDGAERGTSRPDGTVDADHADLGRREPTVGDARGKRREHEGEIRAGPERAPRPSAGHRHHDRRKKSCPLTRPRSRVLLKDAVSTTTP